MNKKDIVNLTKKVFEEEIFALQKISERIGDSFAETVEVIYQSKGKVIVAGVGKTSHIANKIVATLNSTGTPAQFLHAAEAIHGDLGLVQPEDIVICISNSGNTPEIRYILPFLKSYASKLIAITGNVNSELANQADIVLDTFVSKEVFDGNVAPTSSTTAQLVTGDAIAMALMNLRGFSKNDFARFHPGGSLGKQLFWKVRDLVNPEQRPLVDKNADMREVINSVTSGKHGITVVLDDEAIIGVITDGDIRRMLQKYEDYHSLKAIDIATLSPKTIHKNELASYAFNTLRKNSIGQIIVLDENEKYYGILGIHTLINEGIEA